MLKILTLISLLLYGFITPCLAQETGSEIENHRYTLYYYQNRIDIQEDYLDNAFNITRIKNVLARSPHIDSIVIYAYASLEGSPIRNDWLVVTLLNFRILPSVSYGNG